MMAKRFVTRISLCFGIILLLWICGCETTPKQTAIEKDGKTYGVTEGAFRHRWWHYYERALSYADGEFFDKAESDLREAIIQRKEDKRRARTYGFHFMDYFPHRELGIVLYQQGRIEEAVRELEESLRNEPSTKAKLYLDRARKSWIETNQLDTANPQIVIRSPKDGEYTRDFSVRVEGVVNDDTYVQQITVNGREVRFDMSNPEIEFYMDVPVQSGENTISVRSTDLMGNISNAEIRVIVDRLGPIIRIDEFSAQGSPEPDKPFHLVAHAYDDAGISEAILGGEKISADGLSEITIDRSLAFFSGESFKNLEVIDRAGNKTLAKLALTDGIHQSNAVNLTDRISPQIELRNMEPDQITYLDNVFIEGSIRDDQKVSELRINQKSILKSPANHVYFSHVIGLKEGDNPITIQGMDGSGNAANITINIRKDMLKVRETGSRLRITVNPFERTSIGEDRGHAEGLEGLLTPIMIQSKRFSVIDREKMKIVLEELKMSQSGLVNEDTALKVGKILATDCILVGQALERKDSVEIYARLIDTETTEVLAAVDLYGEQVDIALLRTLSQGLSLRLAEELPIIEGVVVQTQGDQIVVDIGKEKNAKKGMKLLVYEVGEPIRHPGTGEIIGLEVREFGQARIESVQQKMSYAELADDARRKAIKPMVMVITR